MSERCVALDNHGRRCRRAAARVQKLHLADDLYGFLSAWGQAGGPTWVAAALCAKHGPDTFKLPARGKP